MSCGISDFHGDPNIECSAACSSVKERSRDQAQSRPARSPCSHQRCRIHAEEEYGDFVSSDQQGFTFYDVDRKAEVTLKYAEARKIKEGYGGYNSVQQRHTDRTKTLLIVLAVAGALGALIGAVAAAKN